MSLLIPTFEATRAWLLARPPLELAVSISVLSLLTEDGALAIALLAVQQRLLSYEFGWFGATSGIFAGDLLVYGGAFMFRHWRVSARLFERLLVRFLALERWKSQLEIAIEEQSSVFGIALLFSHLIPGTRFFLYSAAGWVGYPIIRFSLIMFVSTVVWVTAVLSLGEGLLRAFALPWWQNLLLVVVFIFVIREIGRRFSRSPKHPS